MSPSAVAASLTVDVVQVRTVAPLNDDLGLGRSGSAGHLTHGTIDGLRVYTVEELKIGEGGGTPLCPFDCDCCF